MNTTKYLILSFSFVLLLYMAGCSGSKSSEEEKQENTETTETEESGGTAILNAAKAEQDNEMYSPDNETTTLYWLNDKVIKLNGTTKCNIYALNVLFKSGYKTPTINALSRDLANADKFTDILPVVGIQTPDDAQKGDIIAWSGHVIIFESLTQIKNDLYAVGWWAGTRQKDNGDNIRNNVCYGKYKLSGYYVVRRPIRK